MSVIRGLYNQFVDKGLLYLISAFVRGKRTKFKATKLEVDFPVKIERWRLISYLIWTLKSWLSALICKPGICPWALQENNVMRYIGYKLKPYNKHQQLIKLEVKISTLIYTQKASEANIQQAWSIKDYMAPAYNKFLWRDTACNPEQAR